MVFLNLCGANAPHLRVGFLIVLAQGFHGRMWQDLYLRHGRRMNLDRWSNPAAGPF